jgi:hypothetical protein
LVVEQRVHDIMVVQQQKLTVVLVVEVDILLLVV